MVETVVQINQELETLPIIFHEKVLMYIEHLKFKLLQADTQELAAELGGDSEADEDFDEQPSEATPETMLSLDELHERNALLQHLQTALKNIKAGEPGISNDTMKQRVEQWQRQ